MVDLMKYDYLYAIDRNAHGQPKPHFLSEHGGPEPARMLDIGAGPCRDARVADRTLLIQPTGDRAAYLA